MRTVFDQCAPLWRAGSSGIARTVIVSGATSQIGRFLLPLLARQGYRVIALSRDAAPDWKANHAEEIFWLKTDIRDAYALSALPSAHCLIHLAPLTILPPQIETFAGIGIRRIIAFSSSSRHSKAVSPISSERTFAMRLAAAEEELAGYCKQQGIRWTVFRPTLIYGLGMDRNVTLISRMIGAVGVFPLFGKASGLRQPVHAADLASACIAALDNPQSFDKAYDLSGGEILTYRAMVGRIFESLHHKPRFVTIPMALFRAAISMLSLVPRYRDFNIAMAQRMNEDLVYAHDEATHDFGFQPKKFTP
ncbi:MAG: NAD-dependent epimerase/dehydratase family protein [Betaproteobacteria bacterium]|nr:NAD-dependent epimerase/dehydratase family protein [Betaproteobacteria bacterium]